jgi:hypothetical protein
MSMPNARCIRAAQWRPSSTPRRNDYIVNAVQMEHIFSGNKTPQQGLDDAVAKGNEILKEFAAQGGRIGDR